MRSVAVLSGDGDGDDAASGLDVWRRQMPPDNEIPGTVAVDAILTRNGDLAVALRSLSVFSNGVALDVAVRVRRDPEPGTVADPYGRIPEELLVGVELADGTRLVGVGGGSRLGDVGQPVEHAPTLQFHGGGGGGREYQLIFWLRPAPGPGDLIVVAASVPLGLPESRTVVPATALAEAAGRRVLLWPREPDRPYERPAAAEPQVPPGGWFEQAVRPSDA